MKQFTKRCLAIVLTFAMTFTLIPSAADMVFAEEMITEEGTQALESRVAVAPRAAYTFEEADLQDKTITDTTGNGYDATLRGEGATIADGMLMLPGGAAGSSAAYVELPGTIFEGQNTLTINAWIKNQTGAGNYAAMYFGTKSKHVDSSFSNNFPLNYWIFNPMETDTKKNLFKSVWTNSDNAGAPYNTEVGPGKGSSQSVTTDDRWRMYTTVITENSITAYYDGERVGTVSKTKTTTDFGTGLVAYIGRSPYNDKFYKGGVYGVQVYDAELTDDDILGLYTDPKINIPAESVNVVGEKAVFVGETVQMSFDLDYPYPTRNITWSSDTPAVATVDDKGRVTAVSIGDATITATLPGDLSASLTVHVIEEVTSLAPNKKYLTVYSTTKHFYTSGDNREQETQSVYMAVSEDGHTFNVLNNGGGVIFSKSPEGTLRITKPRIYIDNTNTETPFTVVASDSDASKGFHVFTSADGVHYYDDTVVTSTELYSSPLKKDNFELMLNGSNILTTDSSITLGNAVELTDEQYKKIVDSLGTVKNTGLEALNGLNITSEQGAQVTTGMLNEMYPSVNATYTDGSIQNFKIDWTDALENVDLSNAGTYALTGKVIQPQYINNLKELNGSTRRDDDPANANPNFPDNYDKATGTVYYDKTKFIEGMADPNIYWDKESGYYYMTASYFPENGDKIDSSDNTQQYDRVVLRRGRTLEELQTRKGNQVTIWKAGNQGYDDNGTQASKGYRYIWAPELHRVGDYWVVYFTESHSSLFNIYCHALILDGDKDPYETALTSSSQVSEWKDYKMRKDESLAASVTDPFAESFCLDMTYMKDAVNGKSYVIWAGKPTASYGGGSTDIFIASVDEDAPWKITSAATRLSCSDYGWERIRYCVNEGPTVLQHDGNVFVCFSVSGTGSEYAIGMCSAKNGEDLLDAGNWTKNPYPLLTSRDVNGEEGPGHNSFTVDKDGNNIFVYHARPTSHNDKKCGAYKGDEYIDPLNDPCRHARLKRVHWAADGTPILKMMYEDELLADYETITLNVTVVADGAGGGDLTELPKPITGISLSNDKIELKSGQSAALTATIEPTDATNKNLTWSVVSEGIAEIQGEGTSVTLVGKKGGTTTVRATAASGVYKECEVTVVEAAILSPGATLQEAGKFVVNVPGDFAPNRETEVSIAIPGSLKDEINNGTEKQVSVDVKIPTNLINNGKINWTAITLPKEVLEAAKNSEKDLTITVNGSSSYYWVFTANDLPATITEQNLMVEKNSAKDAEVKGKLNDDEEGMVYTVARKEDGIIPGSVSVDTAGMNWKAGDVVNLSYYNPSTDSLVPVEGTYTVGADGKVTIKEPTAGTAYVLWRKTVTAVTGVTLSKDKLTLAAGSNETLTATVLPENASDKTVTWKSSDDKIATVDSNGKVVAKKAGTAVITATTQDGGQEAECSVTVVSLSLTKVTLGVNETLTLKVNGAAKGAEITWTPGNKKVADVKNGKVTAKKVNKKAVAITAEVDGVNLTCKVTVKAAPKGITLNKKSATLKKGKTFQIKVKKFAPKNAASYKLTYSVDKKGKKAVSVDKNGKIKAKNKGKATITVTTFNKKKATIKITVK